MEKKQEILDHVKTIQDEFRSTQADVKEEEHSFIDKINKLVQMMFADDSISVYDVLDKQSLEEWKKQRLSRWIKRAFSSFHKVFYFMFLVTIIGFLVSEALSFYAIDGIITPKTYLKAILTELSFIFLSGYRAIGLLQTIWVNTLRAGIFVLMVFVISSQTLMIGTQNISETKVIQQQIDILEKRIEEKEKEIVYYRDVKNWGNNTRDRILEKEKLNNKLMELKEKQASGKSLDVSEIERYKMYGRAMFRVLLLLISVLITRRIFIF